MFSPKFFGFNVFIFFIFFSLGNPQKFSSFKLKGESKLINVQNLLDQ